MWVSDGSLEWEGGSTWLNKELEIAFCAFGFSCWGVGEHIRCKQEFLMLDSQSQVSASRSETENLEKHTFGIRERTVTEVGVVHGGIASRSWKFFSLLTHEALGKISVLKKKKSGWSLPSTTIQLPVHPALACPWRNSVCLPQTWQVHAGCWASAHVSLSVHCTWPCHPYVFCVYSSKYLRFLVRQWRGELNFGLAPRTP